MRNDTLQFVGGAGVMREEKRRVFVLKERHQLFAVDLEREFRPKRKQNRLRKGEK